MMLYQQGGVHGILSIVTKEGSNNPAKKVLYTSWQDLLILSARQMPYSHGPVCHWLSSDQVGGMCRTPTLLISSAKDRLLGSLKEGARLERVLGNAKRVVLPKSGHTALLEVNPQHVTVSGLRVQPH